METKIDKLLEKVSEVERHLAVYNEQLGYHIKRTNLLEAKMEHVDSHVKSVNAVFKFLLSLAAMTALVRLLVDL